MSAMNSNGSSSVKRILIVDDEPNVMRVLKLMLERAGHRVRTACDGVEGLAQLRAEPPDVLVTDIQMPRMDGRELVQTLHAEMPERGFDIYVMTSMTERDEREWVRKIPRVVFLEKPVSPRQLVARLAQRQGEGSSPGAADDGH
jgi:CheY-like chemotaxis protein